MLIQVLRATHLDMGLISMLDPDSGELALAVHHQMPEPLVRKLTNHGLKGTLCAMVYDQQKAISINDMEKGSPIDASGLLALGLRAYQGVPLEARGKVLGTLCAFSRETQSDLSQALEMMQIVGQQVGIAIENAQLFQRTQQQAEREAAINTISQRIQATTSVEEALQVAVRELGRTLGAQRATIQLGVPQREAQAAPVDAALNNRGGNGHSGGNGAGKNGH
jgi:GAF domain-containing protein